MQKKILRNDVYKKFIFDHILKPYQNLAFDMNKPISDMSYYTNIIDTCRNNPNWERAVFSRIANIYGKIEKSIFPDDVTSSFIQAKLIQYGVELI